MQSVIRLELPSDFVAAHQRRRIMTAAAELIGEHGYHATKVADIVRRAGLARETLYEHFEGKEALFLAIFDEAIDEAIGRIEFACFETAGWAKRVEAGLAAFLGHLAEQPALARACLVEAPTATAATTEHYEQAIERCVQLARRSLPYALVLPPTIEESLVGSLMWIVYRRVRRREAARIEELLPELTDFLLAPYIGAGVIEPAEREESADAGGCEDRRAR